MQSKNNRICYSKSYVALIFDWEKNNPSLSKEELAELLDLYIFQGISANH